MRKACDWVVELFNKYLTKATKYNITYNNLARQAAALTYTTSVKQCFIMGSKTSSKCGPVFIKGMTFKQKRTSLKG